MLSAATGSTADQPQLTIDPQQYDSSSILVRFQPGAAAQNAADILPGASNGRAFSSVPGLRVVKLGQGVGVEAALHAFRSNPNVLYAEPNFRGHTLLTPNDPSYPALYGLDKIEAPAAWDITTGNGSIVVGVIDTGVDYTHPDLAANMWTNPGEDPIADGDDDDGNGFIDDIHGYNFVSYNGESIDDYFHGTHVAGTIGAVGNNGIGVVGVNWNTQIMSLKWIGADGYGYTADAIAAIDYATMMRNLWVSSDGTLGANIRLTNNSWRIDGFDQGLLDAIDAGGTAGVLFVAAAGNFGEDADIYPMYPAAYDSDNILSVAATDAGDNIAYFSNWGLTSVDLGAPGLDIYSTFPTYTTDAMAYYGLNTDYETISGTSMATPHVSGVAALAWSLNPSATVAEIRSAILGNVDPIASLATDGPTPVATGGRLNAHKTLQAIGMAVAGSTPAAGSIISTQPTDFVVNFSHPYDPDTVDVNGSDLAVNGVAATSRTLTDSDTVTFHFDDGTPIAVQGVQTMHIAAGALSADDTSGLPAANRPVHEWNATFRYDFTRMEVTSTTPGDGSAVQLALTSLDVNLNEEVDPNSVSENDLALSQGTVTGVEVLPGDTTIRFTLSGITTEGTLYASIAAGAFADDFGNPNLAYSSSYSLDIGTIPFPTPLASMAPFGSLIYDPPFAGVLHDAADTDSFTIGVDAGQTITVVVHPNSAWQPTILLSGVPGGSSPPAASGQDAVLQTVGLTTEGDYAVTVGSAAGFGSYTLEIILNAAIEMESHGGTTNNSPGTAQNLDMSFIPLLKTATRGAVLGRTDGNISTTLLAANFENATGDNNWTIASVSNGLWHNSVGHKYEAGHSAISSMYFGAGEKYQQKGRQPETFTKGTYEVVKKGKGGGAQAAAGHITSPNIGLQVGAQVTVDFNYILQTDGVANQDNAKLQILRSSDGAVLKEVKYDDVAESSVWRAANTVDISAFAGQTVQLRFSFNTENEQNNKFEGWYVDDVVVRQTVPHDNYSFTIATDQRVTVVLQSAGDVNVMLRNAAGTATLATSAPGPINVSRIIYNYDLPGAGTYNLAITGQANADYTMLVLLDAVFDSELNNSFDTAQNMDGVVGSLGYLGVEGRVGYFTDYNEFSNSPAAAIVQAGLTPVQITNISTFDLSTIDVLMVNEADNGGLSAALSGRLAAIQTWVAGGGVFMVHDRFVSVESGAPESNPFLLGHTGPGGIEVLRDFANGPDLDVIPPGSTLVISGPHGTIDNTSLDGGNYSNHGFALGASLPASATRILSAGPNSNNVAAFSYPLGSGAVYYSTIPLDFYLDSPFGQPHENLAKIYTPNMLTYGDTLNPAPASDWYSVTAAVGETLTFLTTTPGGGLGHPDNGLNPHIELYGPSKTLIVSGDTKLRNETISYTVPAGGGGLYRIKVTAEDGTTGEYFLDPIQIVPPPPPLPLLVAATARSRKAGTGATSASPLASAALSRQQPARQNLLDTVSVDALFAGTADRAGRKTSFYKPQPQAEVADSLLDLLTSSVSRGKKGSVRARH